MRRIILVLGLVISTALGAAPEDELLAARDAYVARDREALAQYALSLQNHILEPYVLFWQLHLSLEEVPADQVRRFLKRYAEIPISEKLYLDWLRVLGKNKYWEILVAEYNERPVEDVELKCYFWDANLQEGNLETVHSAKALWQSDVLDLPASCLALFDKLNGRDLLPIEDVWQRLRLSAAVGTTTHTKRYAQFLPMALKKDYLNWVAKSITKFPHELSARAQREAMLAQLLRLAREDHHKARVIWQRVHANFSEKDRGYVWAQFAHIAARKHDAIALEWFREAGDRHLSDLQLAWKTRAALRLPDWAAVLASIEAMSASEQGKAAWQYWKARALKALDRQSEANEIFAPLSREFSYYGQLAGEELGVTIGNAPVTYRPREEEISAIAELPATQRALALYRLGLRAEANREWMWLTRNFDDKKLLAAAELARRYDWLDRAIYAADKTRTMHDFALRYPTPHREILQSTTRQMQLDEAWVYGLIRQESRFMEQVRSSAGASGLMQLMPATAAWTAKRLGISSFRASLINQVEMNILLGNAYLKYVLDSNNRDAVLATAAYNAGPQRAKRWRDDKPLEGAIYVETIPFTETREYVQKVMSNMTYYAARLGQTIRPLKQRLGIIAPKGEFLPSETATTEVITE